MIYINILYVCLFSFFFAFNFLLFKFIISNLFNQIYIIAGTNVAFRKPTNQSTTVRGGDASHGNDGDSSTEHDGKRCTETQSEPSPWWKVDLLKSYSVKVVRVTTRGCCGNFPFYFSHIYIYIFFFTNEK